MPVLVRNERVYSGGGTNIWQGTKAEYEAQKETIPNGTFIIITDDDDATGNPIVSEWTTTPLDTNIPSEKLVKGSLDKVSDTLNSNTDYLKGKNLFDKNNVDKGGYINIKKEPFGYSWFTDTNFFSPKFIEVDGNSKYIVSGVTVCRVIFYDSNKTYISTIDELSGIFTTPSNAKYIRFNVNNAYLNTFQLEKGTVASSYIPFAESNVTLTEKVSDISNTNNDLKMLGYTVPTECPIQNYTDANGVFHQRVGRVDLGSLTWDLFKSDTNVFNTSVAGIQNTQYAQMYSNIYNLANNKTVSEFANMDMRSSGNSAVVFIRNTSYSDIDAFKSAMTDQYLYYELVTEVTKSVDGNEISNSKYKLLWENSSPTSEFTPQNITLSSNDYDYLDLYHFNSTDNTKMIKTGTLKGKGLYLSQVANNSGTLVNTRRQIEYVNETTLSVGNTNVGNTSTTGNANIIPYRIYGGKF